VAFTVRYSDGLYTVSRIYYVCMILCALATQVLNSPAARLLLLLGVCGPNINFKLVKLSL